MGNSVGEVFFKGEFREDLVLFVFEWIFVDLREEQILHKFRKEIFNILS